MSIPIPILIYDDRCYLCYKFARIVNLFAKGKFLIIGHYSDEGITIKSKIFEKNYDSTKMFWLVTKKTAYGGRSAILPLIKNILKANTKKDQKQIFEISCTDDCKNIVSFFTRTKILFTNSAKIQLEE